MMMLRSSHELDVPLPRAGEVGAARRVRVLSSGGVSLRRYPLPIPPPQAGEGADHHRCARGGRHD
ncbi:hypothetical protein GPL20_12845 [Bradyrhizobium cajani]|uniref:Uncharacterized protein n=1 Tax=Bradyrhizobium cajani TaxID=1928661 RepID=A0A844TD64_9BRAD|nr:hypothetical protein [Bradyrhizobium cajani]